MKLFRFFVLFWIFFLPFHLSKAKPKSGSGAQKSTIQPLKKQAPFVQEQSSSTTITPPNKKKQKKVGGVKHAKKPDRIISDKTGPVRKLSSEDIKQRVADRFQPLFNICAIKGKTTQQKTDIFIKHLKKIRTYTVDEEENSFMLTMEDRLILHSIRSQIDSALADIKDFQKKGHSMGPQAIHSLFEQIYLADHNVADNVPISAIAPWWLKQMLTAIACINQNPISAPKKT